MKVGSSLIIVIAALALGSPAWAQISGGGSATKDCWAQFAAPSLSLNFPPTPKKSRELRCFDGDAGCDLDGEVNGACEFPVDVCLFTSDPALPQCTPSDVQAATVKNKKNDPGLASLQASLDALLPATNEVCTSGETLVVPLKTTSKGLRKRGRQVVRIKTETAAGKTSERLRLTCMPREWPSHGFDHRNTRASLTESQITPGSAASLQVRWEHLSGTVSGTPAVMNGRVFFGSWDGFVYALDAKTGAVKWSYDTESAGIVPPGVKGSVTLTADGRLLVGDAAAVVHCLDQKKGTLLWKTDVAASGVDDIWSSPVVANDRVYVTMASHLDQPCTRGHIAALDLNDGTLLWDTFMVPEMVCDNDTSVTCATSADCGLGTCVDGRGSGITASPAVDPTGESIYVNTVGCYTYPSIGNSDSILKLDAASGAILWASRLNEPEQFGACSVDPSIDCGDASFCPGGTCDPKANYHDFGFINGPLLVEAPDPQGGFRTLVVSGSKDGSLYALDPDSGSLVWQNAVQAEPVTPEFAGFGLFNGAVGYADERFHAALFQMATSQPQPEHLMAFHATDGTTDWDEEIGVSWGHIGLAGGVVWTGTQGQSALLGYDAATGAAVATLPMPGPLTSGPSIVDGTLYVGFGVFGPGGVRAFELP